MSPFISFRKLSILLIVSLLMLQFTSCFRGSSKLSLPVLYITTEEEIPWEERIPFLFSVVTDNDSIVLDGKVKLRGGFSSKFYKHSYALKLYEAQSLCGMPSNRNWILNASYIDKTFMRHKLCYDLFNLMGDNDLAPQSSYALVRENGRPVGLYLVTQRLNKQVLQLNSDDHNAVIFKEPKIFYPDDKLPSPSLFDENYQEQTYPDFDKRDCSYMMDSLRAFIIQTPDQEFYEKVGEIFDLQNVIDWHLFLLFTNGGDNVNKNFYLYKQDSQTPYRIALWDCDHSFGRDCDNEKNMLERLVNDKDNLLLNRLLQSNDYQLAMTKRYRELRDSGIFSYDRIQKMMKDNDPWVRLGLEENMELWPFDSENYYDSANYDEEYALILEFVTLNLQRLDQVFGY